MIRDGFIDAIGNTPLIKLKKASQLTGCTILGKAEFLNPGGSVKDRAARYIIEDAEKKGMIQPGGLIVEGTAGNTGISLALAANTKGYRSLIVIPDSQSQEKKDMIKLAGATLKEVPPAPYSSEENYVRLSGRIALELGESENNGVLWANQFDNQANRHGHYISTGPEIWTQTNGNIDGFTCAVGSGGSLAGITQYLKEKNPNIVCALSDPMGSGMYSYYKHGEFKPEGNSITEGIGQGRVTGNLEDITLDEAFQISDDKALNVIYDLITEEGLCLGGSSGINVAGAMKLAEKLGPGKTIVTLLCDNGTRYQSKLFNPNFLQEKGLPVPKWL